MLNLFSSPYIYVLYSQVQIIRPPLVLVGISINSEQVSLIRPIYIHKCILVLKQVVLTVRVVLITKFHCKINVQSCLSTCMCSFMFVFYSNLNSAMPQRHTAKMTIPCSLSHTNWSEQTNAHTGPHTGVLTKIMQQSVT